MNTKSENKELRDFAQRMINDHSAVQQSVIELSAKLNAQHDKHIKTFYRDRRNRRRQCWRRFFRNEENTVGTSNAWVPRDFGVHRARPLR